MNSVLLTVIMNTLRQMPTIVNEVEAGIKTAESPEEASQKVKDMLGEVAKLIETLTGLF